MRGDEVPALICKAQNAGNFTVLRQGWGGELFLTAGCYNAQPKKAGKKERKKKEESGALDSKLGRKHLARRFSFKDVAMNSVLS